MKEEKLYVYDYGKPNPRFMPGWYITWGDIIRDNGHRKECRILEHRGLNGGWQVDGDYVIRLYAELPKL